MNEIATNIARCRHRLLGVYIRPGYPPIAGFCFGCASVAVWER